MAGPGSARLGSYCARGGRIIRLHSTSIPAGPRTPPAATHRTAPMVFPLNTTATLCAKGPLFVADGPASSSVQRSTRTPCRPWRRSWRLCRRWPPGKGGMRRRLRRWAAAPPCEVPLCWTAPGAAPRRPAGGLSTLLRCVYFLFVCVWVAARRSEEARAGARDCAQCPDSAVHYRAGRLASGSWATRRA